MKYSTWERHPAVTHAITGLVTAVGDNFDRNGEHRLIILTAIRRALAQAECWETAHVAAKLAE